MYPAIGLFLHTSVINEWYWSGIFSGCFSFIRVRSLSRSFAFCDEKRIKVLWKQWLKGYIEETKEIIKTNPKGRHIACEDCSKEVSKSSFLTHRTVNGCPNLNPRIKLYNWI